MKIKKSILGYEPAYHNRAFLESDDGRSIRILSEYLEPLFRLRKEGIHETVVFFGSARLSEHGPLGNYYQDARLLAKLLCEWSCKEFPDCKRFTICSGGAGGIMEAANRGAADAGCSTIGLNIGLPHEQRPNQWVTPSLLFEFHYFFMRKLWFSHLARALIAFPGGFGTIDEFMEIVTLAQTQKIQSDITIILYGSEYWNKVINFEYMAQQGMINSNDIKLIHRIDDVQTAFELLKNRLPTAKLPTCPEIAKANFSNIK